MEKMTSTQLKLWQTWKVRKLVKWTFYLCSIIGLVALVSMMSNICHWSDIYDCPRGENFCLEFLSTYITSCKYQAGVAVLPWLIYYSLLVCCCILHFILFQITKGYFFHFYITIMAIIQFLGISLIFTYDNRNLVGIQSNYPDITFVGYIVDNNVLHNVGVFLFVISTIFSHLTWLVIRKFLNKDSSFLPTNNPKINNLIRLEYLLDLFYITVIVSFFVFFVSDSIHPAIVLEYVLIVLYVLLVFCAVQIFNNQQKQLKHYSPEYVLFIRK